MNYHQALIASLFSFFLVALSVAYTFGVQRGRMTRVDDVNVWTWNFDPSAYPSPRLRAKSPLGELMAYETGAWEVRLYVAGGRCVGGGKEPSQAEAQIRAMRVYRALTEAIVAAGGDHP